jgi:catechol 2,3-dioxygenase-like lactoylglutathione lyase family enzyme
MLGSLPIIAFVATTQPDAAQAFYADVLGLSLKSRDPYALEFDAGGTLLRVAIVERLEPRAFTILGWIVPDIESTARQLAQRGVTFIRYDGMQQDELGIWHAPSGAQVAWFADPDGNTLSITQL